GAQTFCSKGPLQIPQLLGSSDKHCILAFEWIPAVPLKEFLSAPDLDFGTLETVGKAIAEMHSQDGGELTPLSREDEAADLIDRANLFCTFCPYLSDQALSLAGRLSKLVGRQPPVNRPIHGDFYMGQVMADGDKIVIVDFDQAALGDPARDFGLLVAQLTRDVLRGELAPERFAEAESALLQGYRSKVDEACCARIPLYTTLNLFRLASEPFRLCEPDWPRRMEAILQKTEDFLQIPA
ncbi:MAG: phosphotransferase family protein, partial [Nitrospinales bacterium]